MFQENATRSRQKLSAPNIAAARGTSRSCSAASNAVSHVCTRSRVSVMPASTRPTAGAATGLHRVARTVWRRSQEAGYARPVGRRPGVGEPSAVRPGTDLSRYARELVRVHDAVLGGGTAPARPRDVVARSWSRAVRIGVDPDGANPRDP